MVLPAVAGFILARRSPSRSPGYFNNDDREHFLLILLLGRNNFFYSSELIDIYSVLPDNHTLKRCGYVGGQKPRGKEL